MGNGKHSTMFPFVSDLLLPALHLFLLDFLDFCLLGFCFHFCVFISFPRLFACFLPLHSLILFRKHSLLHFCWKYGKALWLMERLDANDLPFS